MKIKIKSKEEVNLEIEMFLKDDNGNLSSSKYIDYRLDLISKQTQRVKYNLTFTLSKVDNVWILMILMIQLDKKFMDYMPIKSI